MLAALIIICLIVAFILLLCVPLDIIFTWDSRQKPSTSFSLEWFFSVFKWDVRKAVSKPGKKIEEVRGKPNLIEEPYGISDFIEIIRTKGLIKQTLRLIRDVFKQIKLKHFKGSIIFGSGDPADTGLLFGFISSIRPFLGRFAKDLSVQPVFDGDAVYEGYLQGTLRLQPIRLTIPLTRFICSSAAIKLARTLVLRKCKKRKYVRRYREQPQG